MSRWYHTYMIHQEEKRAVEETLQSLYEEQAAADELSVVGTESGRFEYAVIPKDAISDDPGLRQRWENNYGFGVTINVSDDERLSFVLEEVPEQFREIVAHHEYIENREWDHEKAIDHELAIAEETGKRSAYLDWVQEHYPSAYQVRRERL